ncbi:MAG: class I SAM-dependent methyltransferase [Cetobacterium sp.]|nr:class I SAM-dependent methyltransferase [Cetobacterium sp.]
MNEISKTLFIPFYFKYKESNGKKTLYDKEAIDFFSKKQNKNILNFPLIDKDINSFIGILSRTHIIDLYLLDLIDLYKIDNIFNIGCGLDFRNRRLDIKKSWFNIDLDEVISFRNNNFSPFPYETNIKANILNTINWNFIPYSTNVFILEGILMYFSEEEVYTIIRNLINKSKKAYFIIETSPEEMTLIKHPSVETINKNLYFKWGTNNISSFSEKVNLKCLKSNKHIDFYKDRWITPDKENEINKIIKNNFRVSLFESIK